MTDIVSKLLSKLSSSLELGTVERCGIVTKRGALVEIENIHSEPERGFHMEPKAFLAAVKKGAVATWHTHPGRDPNLSEEDMAGFRQWPSLDHHIVGIRDGAPTVHTFNVRDGIVLSWS